MQNVDVEHSKSMLDAILNSAVGAIIAIDSKGVIQSANPATEKLFGYKAAELIGQNVSMLMPEPHRSRHDAYIAHYLATGERRIIGIGREEKALRKDGSTFPIHLAVSEFEVEGQRYFAGIVHDLSTRMRLEAEIDRQALLFQAVFDHVPEALLITDPDLRLLLINPATQRLFGYSFNELSELGLSSMCEEARDCDRIIEELNALERDGKPSTAPMPARLRCRDGRILPCEIIGSAIRSAGGRRTGIVVLVRDLTEDLRREEALLKSQRLEAIGQLTGGVAHDFNNLLTIITGNLELVEPFVDDARAHDHIRRAAQAADAGARLTSRLLTFARRRRLKPHVVHLNEQVRAMTELLRRTLGESIELSTVLAPDLWATRTDPSEIENAVVNLAINARDAMPGGGKLILETTNVVSDGDAAGSEAALGTGEFVRLSVSDTGSGMPREVLARAFEPFFTTKPHGRGTGLGLSTIYGFVKQSKGHVTIYSEPGRGSTVNIYLPRYDAASEGNGHASTAATPHMASGETILLVEDNPEVRAVAVGRLERLGYRVIETTTAQEAISQLESGLHADAVFSDVVMPGGLSGFDLARWIGTNRPGLPLLLTSGFAEEVARNHEPDGERAIILRKPYTQAELAHALSSLIARRTQARPNDG